MNRNCFKLGEIWHYGISGQLLLNENNKYEWTNPTIIIDIDTNLALHCIIKYKSLLYNDINEQKNVFFSRTSCTPSIEVFQEKYKGCSYINIDFQVNKTTTDSFYKFIVKILLFLMSKDFVAEEKIIFESIYCVEVLSKFVIEENVNNNNNDNRIRNNRNKNKKRYTIRIWKSNEINNFTLIQYLAKIFSPEIKSNTSEYNSDVLYLHTCLEKIVTVINDLCNKYINDEFIIKNKEYFLQKQRITKCSSQLEQHITTEEINSLISAVIDVPFKIKITSINI